MTGKRITNPAGSSNALRADVLRVLGVLKVATVDQIQRIAAPHLTYRHITKPTPAARKTARTAAHLAALADLRKHGLVEDGGRSRSGEVLRHLTTKGLEAAAYELGRLIAEMGGTARGAGRSGAAHAMAVNETIINLLRPKPDLNLLADDEPAVLEPAHEATNAPDGIGTIASYATEIPLPATGTWSNPGRGGAQADIVLTAPEDGVPLLFIEVDNCYETPHTLAAKIEKYMRFFERSTGKNVAGIEQQMWRTRWSAPKGPYNDSPHPPVLLVFNRTGPRNPNRTVPQMEELTRWHWQGRYVENGYHLYDECIPIVATGLGNLRSHGPTGPVFYRFGRRDMQPLTEAISNPRREAADARAQEKERQRQKAREDEEQRLAQERAAAEAAEREAQRPVCTDCGRKFTDERWEALQPDGWDASSDSHPQLCSTCKARAIEIERQTQTERRRQEQEEAEAAQQAGGWRARFRS